MTDEGGELLAQSRDALTVKRVFGDPIERDGVTVIPVATISGLLGGGQGGGGEGADYGEGGGYGFMVHARPAGAYVIKDGEVSWEPAISVNAIVVGGQFVALILILAIRAILRARTKARPD